jgi:hypothetical protein
MSRLRPSMRRISDSGCTGWPTPAARDYRSPDTPGKRASWAASGRGPQLPNLVADLAGWATPNTPSGGKVCPAGTSMTGRTPDGRKLQVSLEHQTKVLGRTGSLSDPTRTDATGALDVGFVCWLQGYPATFLSCAP